MAKSKLDYWLGDGKEKLITIATEARTDKEIYEAMGVGKDFFYDAKKKSSEFSAIIKNAREKHIDENIERLKQLHEDMWAQAHKQVYTETYQILGIDENTGKLVPKSGRRITKEMPGDTTLQIYLDKTYGDNVNHEEIKSRADMNRSRQKLNELAVTPETINDSDILKAIMEAGR